MKALEVYTGSEGALTRAYYAALEQHGPAGIVAVNLFRAQKCSTRAKKYRGGVRGVGSYRGMAYDRKAWSMGNLVKALEEHGDALGIAYGWNRDPLAFTNPWVLYVDLPNGQVSFHSPTRGEGPDYAGEWDAMRASEERILAFCDGVMRGFRVGRDEPLDGGTEVRLKREAGLLIHFEFTNGARPITPCGGQIHLTMPREGLVRLA